MDFDSAQPHAALEVLRIALGLHAKRNAASCGTGEGVGFKCDCQDAAEMHPVARCPDLNETDREAA